EADAVASTPANGSAKQLATPTSANTPPATTHTRPRPALSVSCDPPAHGRNSAVLSDLPPEETAAPTPGMASWLLPAKPPPGAVPGGTSPWKVVVAFTGVGGRFPGTYGSCRARRRRSRCALTASA